MGSLNFAPDTKMHSDANVHHQSLEELAPEKLNVIVRFHDPSKIQQLSHCLLALFGQAYDFMQPVIVLQGFSIEDEVLVKAEVAKWPWDMKHSEAAPLVINCENPLKRDLRSKLINIGIQASNGQYLSILDYDDVIYGDAYTHLISRLQNNERNAVAFGNILRTDASPFNGFLYHEKKIAPFHGNDKIDLFVENFCPIHSFVVDRTRAPRNEMYFDEEMSKNEDYHFLVRLLSKCEGDFDSRSKIVGEYYVRTDGSNTINSEYSDPSANKMREWEKSFVKMEAVFVERATTIPISEARYMRTKLREMRTSSDNELAVAHHRVNDFQAQLDEKIGSLKKAVELCKHQEITIKSILRPVVASYSSNPKATERVAVLHVDAVRREKEMVSVQGWCIQRNSKTSPHQAFLHVGGELQGVPFLVSRADVANHFGVDSLNGFDVVFEAPQQKLAEQAILFIAIFLDGQIFITEIKH